MRFELTHGSIANAKRLFYRAVHACPWSKQLWMDAFRAAVLRPAFTNDELRDILAHVAEKGIHLRIS